MYTLNLPVEEGFLMEPPSFTFSHTLTGQIRKPIWMSGEKVKEELAARGLAISKQTLFNLEEKQFLTTNRLSPRKVLFNLNEVLAHYSLPL